ncbi:C40 family peptidase [Citricoccus sp. NPDC079358]|uniref:Cell wall-associated NlpC family hydrolase n=1 Tax=Citricoccus muralis TaxID=169134 RepID=A0A3D9LHI1_9MICC|nr:C40 family peptidase [Citricoccus muralis]REE04523.1 cell wall-associated NlpC family hydrolase [Citricoccus muralis]
MNYPTRRDRLAAELQARRSRRRRSLTVGALGVTTAAGALLAGVAPASANDGSQQASSYQDWSYQGSSSSSSETSSASDYSTASAGSSSEGASYQLASYSSTSGSYGAAADWAVSTANDSSVGYSYGGNGPSAYDCSGFTQNAFAQSGVDIPRTSGAQFSGASQYVGLDDLQVGDLVFWSNNGSASGIYHVAMYVGDGKIAHARNYTEGVSVTDVDYSPTNMMGTAARY